MDLRQCAILPVLAAAALGGKPAACTIDVPADYSTIQAAIDAAVNGDVVCVAAGTYNESINFQGKAITLRGSGKPQETVIDAPGAASVVTCNTGEGRNTIIAGFTITGASTASSGGGMYVANSSPTIIDCRFVENTATDDGAGIYVLNGSPTLIKCHFVDNHDPDGAGIYNLNGHPLLVDCVFEGNSVAGGNDFGGGMLNNNSNPLLVTCRFLANSADRGGGMANAGASRPFIYDCAFADNSAQIDGGGIYTERGTGPVVIKSDFCNNTPDHISGPWLDCGGNLFDAGTCQPCPDVNGDNLVNVVELLLVLARWGTCPP